PLGTVAREKGRVGRQGRGLRSDGEVEVWVREQAGARTVAIALLNRAAVAREIRVQRAELGFGPRGDVRIRDLWRRADLADRVGEIIATVEPHSAAVLGIAPY